MGSKDRNRDGRSARPSGRGEESDRISAEEVVEKAPPGRGEMISSPPAGPADNPVVRSSKDVGDILADEVREGRWKSREEEGDERRGA